MSNTEKENNQKQGVWIICSDGYYPYCNQCGYEPPWVSQRDMRTPYCPNCGAKMLLECEERVGH